MLQGILFDVKIWQWFDDAFDDIEEFFKLAYWGPGHIGATKIKILTDKMRENLKLLKYANVTIYLMTRKYLDCLLSCKSISNLFCLTSFFRFCKKEGIRSKAKYLINFLLHSNVQDK